LIGASNTVHDFLVLMETETAVYNPLDTDYSQTRVQEFENYIFENLLPRPPDQGRGPRERPEDLVDLSNQGHDFLASMEAESASYSPENADYSEERVPEFENCTFEN